MKTFKVLGGGCAKCKNTAQLIEQQAMDLGVDIALEKVEEMPKIMAYGVMSTPAVVINEEVVPRVQYHQIASPR